MMLIILSAGHSNVKGRDRGACFGKHIEGDLTVEFRQLVFGELKKLGVTAIMDGNNTILQESLNYFKKFASSKTINVEYHWNSFNSKSTGTEVLIPENPSNFETEIAKKIAQSNADLMKITLRNGNGVRTELQSHHGKLGWMRLPGENVLVEMCFISNETDMEAYHENKFNLAKQHAIIIFNFAAGTPQNIRLGKIINHSVKSNETLYSIANFYKVTVDQIKKDNNLSSDKLLIEQNLIIKT